MIDSFFTSSFRHNLELQKALKDFIQVRESELSALVFYGGSSIIRWKVDDIYLFFLEQKHYKIGKGVVLNAKKKAGFQQLWMFLMLLVFLLKILEFLSYVHAHIFSTWFD